MPPPAESRGKGSAKQPGFGTPSFDHGGYRGLVFSRTGPPRITPWVSVGGCGVKHDPPLNWNFRSQYLPLSRADFAFARPGGQGRILPPPARHPCRPLRGRTSAPPARAGRTSPPTRASKKTSLPARPGGGGFRPCPRPVALAGPGSRGRQPDSKPGYGGLVAGPGLDLHPGPGAGSYRSAARCARFVPALPPAAPCPKGWPTISQRVANAAATRTLMYWVSEVANEPRNKITETGRLQAALMSSLVAADVVCRRAGRLSGSGQTESRRFLNTRTASTCTSSKANS